MKHPTPEELVSWAYGESAEPRRMSAHVESCRECRAQVDLWRATMKTLDDLPAPAASRRVAPVSLLWLAAAAVLFALGVVAGRFAFVQNDAEVRTAMQKEVQQQIAAARGEWMRDFEGRQRQTVAEIAAAADARIAANGEKLAAEFTAALQQARASDREAYLTALSELNQRYQTEIAGLKKGIETVVAAADYGFEATGQRLAQLAAAAGGNSPQE